MNNEYQVWINECTIPKMVSNENDVQCDVEDFQLSIKTTENLTNHVRFENQICTNLRPVSSYTLADPARAL